MLLATTRASVTRGLVLALVTLLAGCQTFGDGALPREDRLLEELMEVYVSERLRFYPVESTLSGLPGNDDHLGSYSRASIDDRVAWLLDFHHKLLGLRPTALSHPAYVDSLWLTSLVKAELFELEERALWQKSAAFYGDRLRLGLVTLLAEGELATRSDVLSGRLRDVPQLLEQAEATLVPADPVWQVNGRASLEACRRLLADFPKLIEGRLPANRVAELAGLSREALRVLQRFIEVLPELQSGDDPSGWSLGEEGLRRYFFYHHLVDWSLDEIANAAERGLLEATNSLTELALDHFASEPLQAVIAREPLEKSPESEVAEAMDRVLSFARSRDGPGPLGASIPVRRVPPYFPGREPVQLWRPRALEPTRGAFLMVREVDPVDANELELLTLREIGGRARQYAQQAGSASLLRRVFSASTTSEGWLAWFERAALQEGFRPEAHELRVEHYRRAILDFTRLLAVVAVHGRGGTLDGAARLFRERAFLSPAAARREAEQAAVDPGRGDSALGRLLIEDLAADYFDAHPLQGPRDLESRLLEEGLLPVALLRFTMVHEPVGP